MNRYVLITPAHNEEAFIEKTITSVLGQTIRPIKWAIVNDASTDRTRQIVEPYAARHEFIQLVNVDRPAGRHYANKVRAFKQGEALLSGLSYEYIGNLDADVSFEPHYMANMLLEFKKDPKLGLGGGMVHSRLRDRYISQQVSLDSVCGSVQLFRRECFEQVGGYIALPLGGVDSAVEIIARMKGWTVRTFPEYRVLEHRPTYSATARPMRARVNEGHRMHSLGYDFLFFFMHCFYRWWEAPRVIGSAAALVGFVASVIKADPILLPPEVVRFLRAEQRNKLRRVFTFRSWTRS